MFDAACVTRSLALTLRVGHRRPDAKFKSSKQAGAHFGLTLKKYHPASPTAAAGHHDRDAAVREALYLAAQSC